MLVEEELKKYTPNRDTMLTIGVFDGVHLGHKYLISKLLEETRSRNYLSGVVTFYQHPEELLSPRNGLLFLTDITERVNLLKNEQVDIVVALSFTSELAQLGARRFVELLQKHLRMRGLIIGPDFALGKGREGNIGMLQDLGREMDFSVSVVPPLVLKGEVVSSTTIRKALAKGDMQKVRELSGRSFSIHGKVVTGAGRGEGLGFPTANTEIGPEHALPPDGVYASRTHINGKTYQAMTNIGQCPTFGGIDRTVETFIFDYHGDLYGSELRIDIVARLRSEQKFDNVDELQKQIAEDIRKGKELLNSEGDG